MSKVTIEEDAISGLESLEVSDAAINAIKEADNVFAPKETKACLDCGNATAIDGDGTAGLFKRTANNVTFGTMYPTDQTAAEQEGLANKIRSVYGGDNHIQNAADIEAYNETPVLGSETITHGDVSDVSEIGAAVVGGVGSIPSLAKGAKRLAAKNAEIPDSPVLGGRHRDTKIDGTKNGTQSHHPIADDISDIATEDAPAIRMDTDDHIYRTGNWGSRKSSKRFRAKQKELIEQGRHDEAHKMGVDDIKAQNPEKYDTHIEHMEKSTPKKADGSIDWSKFKKKKQ